MRILGTKKIHNVCLNIRCLQHEAKLFKIIGLGLKLDITLIWKHLKAHMFINFLNQTVFNRKEDCLEIIESLKITIIAVCRYSKS